jgi:hypothetical protein
VQEENVGRLHLDVELIQRQGGEVLEVAGHDHPRATSDRGRQDVSILRMVRHRWHQHFVPFDERFGEGSSHVSDSSQRGLLTQIELAHQVASELVERLVAPMRPKQARLREAQERVSEGDWEKDARVQRHIERGHLRHTR